MMLPACRLLESLPLWLLLMCTACVASASAQTYPANPVRLIISTTPNSGPDTVAQILRGALAEELGNTLLIEHIPGAAGSMASTYLAQRDPDGYEMLLGSSNMTLAHLLPYNRVPDPETNFALVTQIGRLPNVIVISPELGPRTIEELIEMARERPGDMTYASAGMGSMQHIAMAELTAANDINMVHIPYKGGMESAIAVQAGDADVFMGNIPSALPRIRSGNLVALAISSKERHSQLPNIPTLSESVAPGFEAESWYGLFLPLGTPQSIVALVAAAVERTLQRPDIRAKLIQTGLTIDAAPADVLSRTLKVERELWSQRLRALGLLGEK